MTIVSARSARPLRLALAGLLASLVVAAAPLTASAATRTVTMGFNDFSPAARTIARGDKVKWVNPEALFLGHDVKSTAPAKYFSSGGAGGMAPGDTYSFTFRSAGRFAYHCSIHSGMTGSVTVPITVSRLFGPARFRVTVATAAAAGSWRHQVQVQKPGASSWITIRTTSSSSVTYTPTRRGTYDFRSRVTNTATGTDSGWSPVVSRTF